MIVCSGDQEGIQGIPCGHRVGLMSLFMIYKAYMPVYKRSRFLAQDGRDQSKVVQEVLADLKIIGLLHFLQSQLQFTVFDHPV